MAVTACSLDEKPRGQIITPDAIIDAASANNFAKALYVDLRGFTAGSYIYASELMADCFNATKEWGQRGMVYYTWSWTSQDDLFANFWYYGLASAQDANFLIDQIAKLDTKNYSDDEKASLTENLAIAYFMRAYGTFRLIQKFCVPYNPATAASDMGVSLVERYNYEPGKVDAYPARSSLEASYTFVNESLEKAAEYAAGIEGKPGPTGITKDVVTALQARVALCQKNYPLAAKLAASLVDGGKYPLAPTQADMVNMWSLDSGDECIMQLYASWNPKSLPSTCGYNYLSGNLTSGRLKYTPDYIPSVTALNAVNIPSDDDLRSAICFGGPKMATLGGEKYKLEYANATPVNSYLFDKFCGNPELDGVPASAIGTYTSGHINKIKPFRIAEQYLIAAEAYFGANDEGLANKYLNALRSNRIVNYSDQTLTGDALMNAIKKERLAELLGEGFRWDDLKRWGDDLVRVKNEADLQSVIYQGDLGQELYMSANDYRWLWPIPQQEIDANPQIKNQQNPGYTNDNE